MVATPTLTPAPVAAPVAPPPRTPRAQRTGTPLRKVYHLTEMGNADRFIDEHGKDVLYCPALGWLVYDGARWAMDSEHAVELRVQATIRGMYREAGRMLTEASKVADAEERQQRTREAELLLKWARRSETDHMTHAVMNLARPRVTVPTDQFDTDPWLLNVQNGTIDLRTGTLRQHRREDYLLKLAPVDYDPRAEAPVFLDFLHQIMCGDKSLVSYLQEVFGYCLTGEITEQVWFTVKGGGQNGKSTLLEAFGELLGAKIANGYALEMSPESITVGSLTPGGSDATPDIARLAGARYVVASETEQGARIRSALIKRLTGGDMIYARQLHKPGFQFMPSFKFFLDTNHQPQVRDTSKGFWRRMRVIPFNFQVSDGQKDKHLKEKLHAEFPGILAWALAGLRRFQERGTLTYPEAVRAATERYREEQDILGLFLREQCIMAAGETVNSQELYNAFKAWVEEQMGERSMAQRSFSQAMTESGYVAKRRRWGIIWLGLRLRTINDIDPEEDTEADPKPDAQEDTRETVRPTNRPTNDASVSSAYADLLAGLPEPFPQIPRWQSAARGYHASGRPQVTLSPPGQPRRTAQGKPLFVQLAHLAGNGDPQTDYAYNFLAKLAGEQERSGQEKQP